MRSTPPTLTTLALAASGLATNAIGAPGDLDATFGDGGVVLTGVVNNSLHPSSVVVQNDGKPVVVGTDYIPEVGPVVAVVRYEADGAVDRSFGEGGLAVAAFPGLTPRVEVLAVQQDGMIVVAGSVGEEEIDSGKGLLALARFTASGQLDETFGNGGTVVTDVGGFAEGKGLALQADSKIVVVAWVLVEPETQGFNLVRYNPDGTLDLSFGPGGSVVTVIGRGSNATGVAVQTDGRIVVSGYAGLPLDGDESGSAIALARYNSDGSLDPTFGQGGTVTTGVSDGSGDGKHSRIQSAGVSLQGDGKILIASSPWNESDRSRDWAVLRYTARGELDTSFGEGGVVSTAVGDWDVPKAIVIQGDGKIVVAGRSHPREGSSAGSLMLARYTTSGDLDPSFGAGGVALQPVYRLILGGLGLALQADGKLVVTNMFRSPDPIQFAELAIVRLEGGSPGDADADGLPDEWEVAHFGGISGQGALDDTDADGYVELLELGLGLDPTVPDPGGLPPVVNEDGFLTMTITKQPGVAYEVQSGEGLGTGDPSSFSPESTTVLDDNAEVLRVRDNVPIGTPPSRYLRVKVSPSPLP